MLVPEVVEDAAVEGGAAEGSEGCAQAAGRGYDGAEDAETAAEGG